MKNTIIASLILLSVASFGLAANPEGDEGKVIAVTSKNWEAEVLKSDKPVLVDFWATWCGPCKKLSPNVAALSKEMTNVKFAKVDIDDNEAIAKQLDVGPIPYLVVLKGGKKIAENLGYLEPDELKRFVADAVKKAQ